MTWYVEFPAGTFSPNATLAIRHVRIDDITDPFTPAYFHARSILLGEVDVDGGFRYEFDLVTGESSFTFWEVVELTEG